MARPRLAIVLAVAALAAACAGTPSAPPPAPDDSILNAGEAMLAKAEQAGAAELAPQAWREARQRLSAGRSLLYRAAAEQRSPSAAEKRRVRRLGEEAYVDARLAFTLTQQNAVQHQLDKLQGEAQAENQAENQTDTNTGNGDSP